MNYLRQTSGLWFPEPVYNLPGMVPGPGFRAGASELSWSTTWSVSFSSEAGSWAGYNFRPVFPAAELSNSGSAVRLTFDAPSTSSLVMSSVYIGRQAAAGDAYDFLSAPTEITFDGGSTGFSILASASIVSDEVTFSLTSSLDYVVAYHPSTGNARYYTTTVDTNHKSAADEGSTVDVTGYASDPNAIRWLSKIEVGA